MGKGYYIIPNSTMNIRFVVSKSVMTAFILLGSYFLAVFIHMELPLQ